MSLRIDKLFGQIQRKTERNLYNKSYRSAIKSQKSVLDSLHNDKKNARKKIISKEILWISLKIVIAVTLSFMIHLLVNITRSDFTYDISLLIGWGEFSLFYLLLILIFIGIYLIRIILWALNMNYD